MTWFKSDDGLHDHPKVVDATDTGDGMIDVAPMGLWVLAGTWAAKHLTDGWVSQAWASQRDPQGWRAHADALVSAGLWRHAERHGRSGWVFHDWPDHQPSSTDVLAQRSAHAERQQAYRLRKRQEREAQEEAARDGGGDASRTRHSDVTRDASRVRPRDTPVTPPRPDPTRPDPTPVPNGTGTTQGPPPPSAGPPHRGSRVPDPFEITDEMRSWARAEAPNATPRDHDAFMDYWRGIPGQKGIKKDWPATWRNWMRRASEEKPTRSNRTGLVEVNGHLVTERTVSNVEVVRRIAEREAQQEQQRLEIEQ